MLLCLLLFACRFDYLHKKQTGGAGQFARIIGQLIPLTDNELADLKFEDATIGMNVPKQYMPAIEKGFIEACNEGQLWNLCY